MSDVAAPPKFVTDAGVRKINPEWKAWKATQSSAAPAAVAPPTRASASAATPAIAVVCNRADTAGTDIKLSAGVIAAENKITGDANVAKSMGLDSNALMDGLYQKLAVYEMPVGLLSRLLLLSEYQCLYHIVDDSGSMSWDSDVRDKVTHKTLTRWQEVKQRFLTMLDVMAWVPALPQIEMVFLNRSTHIRLKRKHGQTPDDFYAASKKVIEAEFDRHGPGGGTPFGAAIKKAFAHFPPEQAVAFYLWNDGNPNESVSSIVHDVEHRANPKQRPVFLFSCSNNDSDVEWLKTLENSAPFCSESDDFADESREVAADLGPVGATIYTYGFYVICLLVGAIDPVLDGLDEGVPLVKAAFDELLGYETSPEEYTNFFNGMLATQRKKRPSSSDRVGSLTKQFMPKFEAARDEFLAAARSSDIAVVNEYRGKVGDIVFAPARNSLVRSEPSPRRDVEREERRDFGTLEEAWRAVMKPYEDMGNDEMAARSHVLYEEITMRDEIRRKMKADEPGCSCVIA